MATNSKLKNAGKTLGEKGGAKSTPAKAKAAKNNGKQGGRPAK